MNLPEAHDWPHCLNSEDVKHLPVEIQLKILHTHLYLSFPTEETSSLITQLAQSAQEIAELCEPSDVDYFLDNPTLLLSHETECQGIKIKYHPSMEGGGIYRSPMFIEVLSLIAPNRIFNHCLEWCSGPGFIGFGLLGKGLCKQLDLADIWQPSLTAAKAVKAPCNVDTWHIRNLCDIQPPRMYDLIVANPPWWPGNLLHNQHNRLGADPELTTLKKFFIDAKNYLTPDGIIVLIEGQTYTGPKDISNALVDTGLELTQVLERSDQWHWFVGIEHTRDFEAGEKV
jgi:hypothetical protein